MATIENESIDHSFWAGKGLNRQDIDLEAEHPYADASFWDGYHYVNPHPGDAKVVDGILQSDYDEDVAVGGKVIVYRKDYKKMVNPETKKEQWVWVHPKTGHIDWDLSDNTVQELKREEKVKIEVEELFLER